MKRSLLLLVILCCGCYKQQVHIDEVMIEKLSEYNLNRPSTDIALYLFVKSTSGMTDRLNINILYRIYQMSYARRVNNFKLFVSNGLNQTQSIDCDALKKGGAIEFQINKSVNDDL